MTIEIDPRVDFAFQRLFGVESNKTLLIDLLNAVLSPPPDQEVAEVVLLNPFHLRDFREDKLSIIDVKARDQAGRWFLVEMQIIGHAELAKRFVFYLAETYTGQLKGGVSYSELKPTILVAFLCDPMFPEVVDYHLTFRLLEESHAIRFTDDLEIHTIELSKLPRRLDARSPRLVRWSYFLKFTEGQEMSQIPQLLLDDPVFRKAYSELQQMSANPDEREEYARRLRNLREEVALVESGFRKGLAQGREQGLEQGREQGLEQGREQGLEQGLQAGKTEAQLAARRAQIRFCERLLKRPRTPSEDLARLPPDELERLAAELQQKCLEQYGDDVAETAE